MSDPTPATPSADTASTADSGFRLISRRAVPLLGVTLEHYRHATGADHYHLDNDDPHRAFMVSFRTVPDDSTGLPHILEHLVLCGSARYPVRDPFFLMIRRSLQTFMNAMTGPDCTYYPFSSQVPKDFENLLGIYLDAVFRPMLNPLDFAQEGYRIEPAAFDPHAVADAEANGHGSVNGHGTAGATAPADPAAWAFKGVVYNEMKGAMGNTDAQLNEIAGQTLSPDTPYRFNSGGDPAVIPTLSHADLVAFHARHYAASNACITSFGDMDVTKLQARLAPYLAERIGELIPPPEPQPTLALVQERRFPVPLEPGQDPRDVSSVSIDWVWGDQRRLDDVLLGELLELLLLGHAGAPLRHALESSGLGRALGGSGYGDLGADGVFSVALKGVQPADYDRFEPLVTGCLERLRDEGFPADEVEAALHQLELSQRTISGDRFPFGLELSMRVTEAWRLGTDPIDQLDQGAAIQALRARVAEEGFWARTLDAIFLKNPHRAVLVADPDPAFNTRQDQAERERLAARIAALGASDRAALAVQAEALAIRQAQEDDVSVLPELMLSDVPEELRWAEGETPADGLDTYVVGTNGILHHLAAIPLGPLSDRDLQLLPLLMGALGKLGVGGMDYTAWAARLNGLCGGVSTWVDLRHRPDDTSAVDGMMFMEVRGLTRKHDAFIPLLVEALSAQRFDEHARLLELVEHGVVGLQSRVAWRGNDLAEAAAMRGFGGRAGLEHRFGGLGRLAWLKDLTERTQAGGIPTVIGGIAEELAALLARIRQGPVRLALIGDAAGDDAIRQAALDTWSGHALPAAFDPATTRTPLPAGSPSAPVAYTTATQVNYNALALPAVPMDHPDAAGLVVAGRYLANNYLHARIREKGGAYGSRASFSASLATFTLSSYRDPRLTATFDDFRAGLGWLAAIEDGDETERQRREAILGVIASIDRPASPAGEGRQRFVGDLMGYGPKVVNAYRARILQVTVDDVRRVSETWLRPDGGTAAVITSGENLSASKLGWESVAL